MGYLINYEIAHLNILYFCNFPFHSPGLRTLENLVFPPLLYHSSVFHTVIWGPLPPRELRDIKV